MKTKTETHTPTPMDRIKSMTVTGTINPRSLALILESKNVDEDTKAFIVRAVNCHEDLVEDLAICLQSFGKDMQNDFRRRIERHLQQAIAKAENLDSDLTNTK